MDVFHNYFEVCEPRPLVNISHKGKYSLPDIFYARLRENGGLGFTLWESKTRGPGLWKVLETEIDIFVKLIRRKLARGNR